MENNLAKLITVIIPYYDSADYIADTIESILNQTYRLFELFLIDDGSSDFSYKICQYYQNRDSRIRLLKNESKGVSSARNKALREAEGEYIIFCDADDLYSPNAFELLLTSMITFNVDMVFGGFGYFSSDVKKAWGMQSLTKWSNAVLSSREEVAEIYSSTSSNMFGVSVWGNMYKKDIIEKYGITFREDISYEEDACFNTAYIFRINNASAIRECIYFWRQRNDSISKEISPDKYQMVTNGYLNRKALYKQLEMPLEKQVALEYVFLAAVRMHLERISNSLLPRNRRIECYERIVSQDLVKESAKLWKRSKDKYKRTISKAILSESPCYIDKVMWRKKQAKKVKGKINWLKGKIGTIPRKIRKLLE